MSDNDIQNTDAHETAGQPEPDDAAQQQDSPSRREAKYRTELRAEQARNAELSKQVAALQRAEVHRMASAKLIDPADSLRDVPLAEFLDDDGLPDQERVNAIADGITARLPHHAAPTPPAPDTPATSSASVVTATVGGAGLGAIGGLGGEPLNINRQQAEPTPGWSEVLRDAATGGR